MIEQSAAWRRLSRSQCRRHRRWSPDDSSDCGTEAVKSPSPNGEVTTTNLWTPRSVATFTLLIFSLFAMARLIAHGGDPTAFISAGDQVTDPALAPELTIKPDNLGYDGQYFHRIARNPFTSSQREFGTVLDRPAYRHQRIGYPLTSWVLSGGGRQALVPWVLIGVNLAAIAALGYVAALLAQDAGQPAWWGFIPSLWPGLMVALAYDLSEALALAALALALLLMRRERWVAATCALTAAGLTRETTLVLAIALVTSVALGHLNLRGWVASLATRRSSVPLAVGLIPIAIAGTYRVLLERHWHGVPPTGPKTPSFIGVPFLPFSRQLGDWMTNTSTVGLYLMVQVALVAVVVLALARSLTNPSAGLPHERLTLIGFLLIMSMLPAWDRSVVFLRWANEAVLLGWLLALGDARFTAPRTVKAVAALAATTAMVWITI